MVACSDMEAFMTNVAMAEEKRPLLLLLPFKAIDHLGYNLACVSQATSLRSRILSFRALSAFKNFVNKCFLQLFHSSLHPHLLCCPEHQLQYPLCPIAASQSMARWSLGLSVCPHGPISTRRGPQLWGTPPTNLSSSQAKLQCQR